MSTSSATFAARPARQKSSPLTRRKAIEGYLYISPFLLGFLIFTGYPLLASFYLSFTSYNILSAPTWIGLENYQKAFTADPQFWASLSRTGRYAMLVVPIGIVASLLAAMLLNQGFRGTAFFRTIFFLPSITPVIASVLIWLWILQPSIGVANYLLKPVLDAVNGPINGLISVINLLLTVHLNPVQLAPPPWVQSTTWAVPSLVILSLWNTAGGSRMIVFLAGLQGVPQELYEASHIDGANRLQRFWNVTVPMISPTIFFNLVISVIGALSVFSVAYIGTQGGPAYATYFYVYHLYISAFQFNLMGYASAMAWIFLLIVLTLTWFQFWAQKRWVFYAGDERDAGGKDG